LGRAGGGEMKKIMDGIRQMEQRRTKKGTGLFGDGKASEKIVRMIVK
jgi:UDP-N-acetylglucosamine 2-epimerase